LISLCSFFFRQMGSRRWTNCSTLYIYK